MSSYTIETHKCFICESKNQYKVITGHTSFGSQDLDLREPEMQRSTIWWWVEECPVCGYVSVQVDDTTSITRDYLETPAYKTCDGINFKSNCASKFYKQHLICLSDNKLREAFFALLHAAWVCDDVEDKGNSILCRKKSLPILSEIIEAGPEDKAELKIIKMDVLRRAGLFDDVKAEFGETRYWRKLLNNIASFQLYLCENKDTRCYRIEDAETYAHEKSKEKKWLKRFLKLLKGSR